MKTQQAGFTLIELVIVIVVLGILAAVAVPQFTNISSQAEEAVFEGAKGAILSQAAILYAENSGSPATGSSIVTDTLAGSSGWTATATGCSVEVTVGEFSSTFSIPTNLCSS